MKKGEKDRIQQIERGIFYLVEEIYNYIIKSYINYL